MKKYMIVWKDEEGNQGAHFTDSYTAAEQTRMDMECGMGWYAEIYERTTDEDGMSTYEFLCA